MMYLALGAATAVLLAALGLGLELLRRGGILALGIEQVGLLASAGVLLQPVGLEQLVLRLHLRGGLRVLHGDRRGSASHLPH